MDWLLISIVAYFLIALQVILDKFMLTSRRVARPETFTFYTGLLSFFTLFIFLPFGGVRIIAPDSLLVAGLSGIIFIFGVYFIFTAIQKNQASQVIPVSGAAIPITTYLVSLVLFEESLSAGHLAGAVFLVLGGLLISFDLPLKINRRKFFRGFWPSVAGGLLLGIAFSLFKFQYDNDNFANVFVWTRLGLFCGALMMLLFPNWRHSIISSLKNFGSDRRENSRTGALFVFNKILGGTGSLGLNYAIALGSVTLVNALIAVEFVFVLLLGLIFSVWHPSLFKESGKFWDVAQKIAATAVIAAGIFMIS